MCQEDVKGAFYREYSETRISKSVVTNLLYRKMEIWNGLFTMASVTACSIYPSSKAGFLCWQLRKIRNEDTNNSFSNLFIRLPYRYVFFSAHPVVSTAASSAVTTATLNSIANLKIKQNNGNAKWRGWLSSVECVCGGEGRKRVKQKDWFSQMSP